MTRKLADAPLEHANNGLREHGLIEVDDVLNNIVAEGILDENARLFSDALDEPKFLVTRSMIYAPLKNTASVTVSTDTDSVAANRIKDELSVGR